MRVMLQFSYSNSVYLLVQLKFVQTHQIRQNLQNKIHVLPLIIGPDKVLFL